MEITKERLSHEIKKCPSCGSVFLEDDHCESCSYRLDFDKIGPPLGARSFYSLQENYQASLNFIEKRINKNSRLIARKKETYKRMIFFRYVNLLELLQTQKQFGSRAYFFYELGDTVIELTAYGISEDRMIRELDLLGGEEKIETALYLKVSLSLKEGKILNNKDWGERFLGPAHYRVGGVFYLKNLILFSSLAFLLIQLSLAFFLTVP